MHRLIECNDRFLITIYFSHLLIFWKSLKFLIFFRFVIGLTVKRETFEHFFVHWIRCYGKKKINGNHVECINWFNQTTYSQFLPFIFVISYLLRPSLVLLSCLPWCPTSPLPFLDIIQWKAIHWSQPPFYWKSPNTFLSAFIRWPLSYILSISL